MYVHFKVYDRQEQVVSVKLSDAQFRYCIQSICNIKDLTDGGVLLRVKERDSVYSRNYIFKNELVDAINDVNCELLKSMDN